MGWIDYSVSGREGEGGGGEFVIFTFQALDQFHTYTWVTSYFHKEPAKQR